MFINDINNDKKWKDFLNIKLNSNYISKKEKQQYKEFIETKKYKYITQKIVENNYCFTIPKKHIISKNKSSKKRIVYSFNSDEMNILKYISHLLYDYDYLFQDNLYSFRKNISVKEAFKKISSIKNINNMYGYKVDITNYFNSINTNILLNNLEKDIDKNLFNLIKDIISNDIVLYNNQKIKEQKGAMAGVPISSFLANYYIKEIDNYFKNENIIYFRYSDDIIIFCNTKEDILFYSNELKNMLHNYKLSINEDKEFFYNPGDKWEFLGFSFCNNTIDLSINTINKIKRKIRRSKRSLRRWMIKKNINYDKAIKAMIKKYNKKFFGINNKELSWQYWFFPIINTSKSLKIIDNYLQDNLRYIATGKHNKKNYKIVPYKKLKTLGYKSLVHEYYSFINLKSNM